MPNFNNSWNYVYILNQNGLLLIGDSSSNPQAAFLTSTGATLTYSLSPGAIDMEINGSGGFFGPLQVLYGGIGRTFLTTFGVLLGEGSNRVHVTAAGTHGQLLIASTTGDPIFATLTSSRGSLLITAGPNSLNIEVSSSNFTFPTFWSVPIGGTGRTALTAYGVLLGEGSNSVHVTAPGTNGQLFLGATAADPAFQSISSTGGTLVFTRGNNTLNIDLNVSNIALFNPLQVIYGGTGRTILTTNGVLLGEGSNRVHVTPFGTDGQVLLGSSTGDPIFNTIVSSLGALVWSAGPNSLGVDLNIPIPIQWGGTSQTTLTTFGVLIGEGSNSLDVTAPGTDGQVLLAATGSDPAFATITSTGATVLITPGPNSLNLEADFYGTTYFNPLLVGNGGTGQQVLSPSGVLLGEGSNSINVTAQGTDGQLLIGSSTGDPAFSTVTSFLGTLSFAFSPGSLAIDVNGPLILPFGGTAETVLTRFGVLLGEGSNGVQATASGTSGQLLIASSTGDPLFASITSLANTLTFTFGPHSLNIEVNLSETTLWNPLPVNKGGLGQTVLTVYGVLLGEGSSQIHVAAAGTDGQLFLGSSTGDPQFNTVTSSLGALAFSAGHGSLNADLRVPVLTRFGGSGATLFTTYGVLLGEGSNGVHVTAPGTNGQMLIGSTTGDPSFSSLTSVNRTITFTFGVNSLNVEANVYGHTFFNPLQVSFGGTGETLLTLYGVLLGSGSKGVNVTAFGTDGQLFIGSSTGSPQFNTLTSSLSTILLAPGHSSLNLDLNGVLPINWGGTARTLLTAFGVLFGEGSSSVNAAAPGTSGQTLIASTGSDPKWMNITSTGGTLTFTYGVGSLNMEAIFTPSTFFNPLLVGNGGTGLTLLTLYGVLLGEGSNNIGQTAAGTNGQVLMAATGANPKFSTISSSKQTLVFMPGPNFLNMDVVSTPTSFQTNSGTASPLGGLLNLFSSSPLSTAGSASTLTIQLGVAPAANGGTGLTLLTRYGVLIGEGSNALHVTAAGTNGQALIASSTGDPKFITITSVGQTLSFTWGANSLNIETSTTFPLSVSTGSTGRTVFTTFGVLIGEGSNSINVTAAGTNGQLLVASTTGDPAFATITSSGGTLTFVLGVNSLRITDLPFSSLGFFNPLQASFGGTGRTLLTRFGVLIGEGSNAVDVTAPGTHGQMLIASTTGDPQFATITSIGGTITFTTGPNALAMNVNFGTAIFNPLQVGSGGTGKTVLTVFGVLIGEGSNNLNVTARGTHGQTLIASTTGDPIFATITSTGNTITFRFGPNSLNIDVVNLFTGTYFNPLQVVNGGTGRTLLTTFGVLIGKGSNNINVAARGTHGQTLLASTTGDPKFASITSTGNTLTFRFGPNSLNVNVINLFTGTYFNPLSVSNGGTRRTLLTTFGVLLGEGSNAVNVTARGTHGQVLIASTTGDPKFSTITSTGGTLTFRFGPNSLNIDATALFNKTFFNPLQVNTGGAGRTLLTTYGVLLGEGSNQVNVTAKGTHGQVLIASTTGDPKFSTITSTGGTLTFTFGPNSLNITTNIYNHTFFNPLRVVTGGTGRTVLTAFGVLLGEGSNQIRVTAAGTNGQLLIGSSTGDPKFNTITSSLATLTFTISPGGSGINIDVNGALRVAFGGTGQTILTTFGVLIGEGSRNVNVTAAGTHGQLLIAATGADPQFSTLTYTGVTLTFQFGPNSLNIDVINLFNGTYFNPLQVVNGGTGRTIFTARRVLLGEGSNALNTTLAATHGQVLIGSTTGDPTFTTITSTGNTLTFKFGPNSLDIETTIFASTFFKPLLVGNGGTGRTLLTTFGVLLGEGSNNINVTARGTRGQVLIASTTGDPKFSTITSTGGTLTFVFGPNALNVDWTLTNYSFFKPLQVSYGGTGRTILTTFGVLIGEGSSNINVTAAGTNGQVLIASTTGDPKFVNLTSVGGTFTFTFGANTLNIERVELELYSVDEGGTNRTVLTTFGVLLGEGSNSVNVTAPGTNGQLLIASTTGDPVFKTITSTGNTITFSFGPNSIILSSNVFTSTFFNPLLVGNGGTGLTLLTTFGVLIGEGSNNLHVTAAGTNGQVLLAGTGVDPRWGTITSSGGTLTFAFGARSLNIDAVRTTLLPILRGGTNRTLLTAYGVLLGEGSNAINVTAPGTDGQVLIGSSTGDPKFSTITSSQATLSFTYGHHSLNVDLNGILNIQWGGTNRTVLTTYGVLLGEGSNSIQVTAPGTSGQLLIAATGANPAFATITTSLSAQGNGLSFTFGPNSLNMDVFISAAKVNAGGTGRTLLTTYGVLIGEGSNPINATAAGTNGQLLIGGTAGDPVFATVTSTGSSIAFTPGANSLDIAVNFSGAAFFNPLIISNGGTGGTLLTSYGVLLGEGSNPINVTAAGTNGQLLLSATGADSKFATLTSTGGSFVFAFGPNGLNIDTFTGAASYTILNISAGTTAITANYAYYSIDSSGGTVTLNFPNPLSSSKFWTIKDRTGYSSVYPIILTTVLGTVTFDGETAFNLNVPFGSLNVSYDTLTSRYELF